MNIKFERPDYIWGTNQKIAEPAPGISIALWHIRTEGHTEWELEIKASSNGPIPIDLRKNLWFLGSALESDDWAHAEAKAEELTKSYFTALQALLSPVLNG